MSGLGTVLAQVTTCAGCVVGHGSDDYLDLVTAY